MAKRSVSRQQQQHRRRRFASSTAGATELRSLRHIHIRGLGKAPPKFAGSGRSTPPKIDPISDRNAHAQLLLRELDAAVEKIDEYIAAQGEIGVPVTKRGIPVTVLGRSNVELQIGDGRPASTRGLKVLNVRRTDATASPSNSAPDQATFFVTKASVKTLQTNLNAYGEWDLRAINSISNNTEKDQGRKPPYFGLFESGASIKETTLRDLWTDGIETFPKERKATRWEVWTQASLQDYFLEAVRNLELRHFGGPSEFVETVVQSIEATPQELQKLVRQSAAIVELRSASSFSSGFFNLGHEERKFAAEEVAARIERPSEGAPRVVVLDTGVNRNNVLLRGTLAASDCKTVETSWGVTDHSGHGTKMAGLAQFGDLEEVAARPGPIVLTTGLESVVVSSPEENGDVPARYALQRAVRLVEKKSARRIYCLAQTAPGESENGRPSSTSAVLDQLAYNDGVETRLFCAAVGNVPHTREQPYQLDDYANRNFYFGIQSPAQAVNALSVGAVSLKVDPRSGTVVAPPGDLMPTSRTACKWLPPRSNKPDIVMEGGNFLVDDEGVYGRVSKRHFVLTTSRDAPARPLAMSGETSTATALAAGLAARLSAKYPKYRMETIRGLMVHAAQWTPAMLAHLDRFKSENSKNAWDEILTRFGWGVPDQKRLFDSTASATTLVIEDELRPYYRPIKNGKPQNVSLKEMKYFTLPWPTDALEALETTEARMRCTLSYFIEPDPQAVTRDKLDRYHSFRLKMDVKRYGETHDNAQARVNASVDDPDPSSNASTDGWWMAQRTMGTLAQHEWRGPAYRLAEHSGISVLPIHGWWSDISSVKHWTRPVRFSLIVSIAVPAETGIDIYREIANRAPADLLVEAPPVSAKAVT